MYANMHAGHRAVRARAPGSQMVGHHQGGPSGQYRALQAVAALDLPELGLVNIPLLELAPTRQSWYTLLTNWLVRRVSWARHNLSKT